MGQHGKHRSLVSRIFRSIACVAALVIAGGEATAVECRQALALGIDVSGSVDPDEYWLQRNGLAAALTDAQVMQAFLIAPDVPVHLMIFEWSGHRFQKVLLPWTAVQTGTDLIRVAQALRTTPRRRGEDATGIGGATLFAALAFDKVPQCARRTLDLSGDGKNNDGPAPDVIAQDPRLRGVVINGLVIGTPDPFQLREQDSADELVEYYRDHVIRGTDAFVERAYGFEDFEDAMRRKLLREISVPAFSAVEPAPSRQPRSLFR